MPSLEVIVALLRNGFCTVKNVAPPAHWIMKPYYGEITCVECIIAPLQAAAVLYNVSAAFPYLFSTAYDFFFSTSLPSEEQWLQAIQAAADHTPPLSLEYAKSTLAADMAQARTKAKVMVCKMIIGTAFVFLCLSSVHKPFPALINWAVVFLELALAFLLTVMASGVAKGRQAAGDCKRLSKALGSADYEPLQTPAALPLVARAAKTPVKLPVAPWLSPPAASDPFGLVAVQSYLKKLSTLEKELRDTLKASGAASARAAAADELAKQSTKQYWQTVLDATTTMLNGVAWCGYGMFPVTYFNTDADLSKWIPAWPGRDFAQYWGNFAGDAAWTVEPALLIVVPFLIDQMVSSAASEAKKRD